MNCGTPGFKIEDGKISFLGDALTVSTCETAVSCDYEGISFGRASSGYLTLPAHGRISVSSVSNDTTRVTAVASADIRTGRIRAGNGRTSESGGISLAILVDASLPVFSCARAMVTCTEAITCVIRELGLGSPGGYTDSGCVDQNIAIVCRPDSSLKLTGTGKHSKLGEFIGRSAIEAVLGSARANGTEPGELGIAPVLERLDIPYSGERYQSCAYPLMTALLQIRDEAEWGMIPPSAGLLAAGDMAKAMAGIDSKGLGSIEEIAEKALEEMRLES